MVKKVLTVLNNHLGALASFYRVDGIALRHH
jgi:hypothetical protein